MPRTIITLDALTGSYVNVVEDVVVNGINVYVSGTLSVTGSSYLSDTVISGNLVATSGISGSLTNLADGTSYLIAGSNVEIVTGSNGAVTISSTASGASGASLTSTSGDAPYYGARAWVNMNGGRSDLVLPSAPFIRDSRNVSSITDMALGAFRVNFTTPMPNANYAITLSVGWPTGSTGNNGPSTVVVDTNYGTVPTVNNFTFGCFGTSWYYSDPAFAYAAVFA